MRPVDDYQHYACIQLRCSYIIRSHSIPVVVDLNLIIALGGLNLALNNSSLLNQALLVCIVAFLGNYNIVVLLNVRRIVEVIVRTLNRLGSNATLGSYIDVIGTNIGNLTDFIGGNVQDGVIRRTVGSQQLNLGTLQVRLSELVRTAVAILGNPILDGLFAIGSYLNAINVNGGVAARSYLVPSSLTFLLLSIFRSARTPVVECCRR